MLNYRRIIKPSCLIVCFTSALLTLYEIVNVHTSDVVQMVKIEPEKLINREVRGYIKLRQFQRATKYEMNKRYILKLVRNEPMEYTSYNGNTKGTCVLNDSSLEGHTHIENSLSCDEAFSYLEEKHPNLQNGGHWQPQNCSNYSLCIIVPYRDRKHHLCVFLRYIIPVLIKQQIDFRIVIAEQIGNGTFNKGKLMNAAFIESTKQFSFHCVIFHDVDLIPENDRNIYPCPWQPTHLSVAIDVMNYRLQYDMLVGGVLAMTNAHFTTVNGFSNQFWGWGGEDDDMAFRILLSSLRIFRPPANIARYKMLSHRKRRPATWKSRDVIVGVISSGVPDQQLLYYVDSIRC